MDFKQLEAFITVSKLKSFSKAANAIYLSQPTISSHIASLERELNVQLFDRTSKEVNLTPVGESFLQYANDIINIRNNAIADVSSFNNLISGELNISATTVPCNSILPLLAARFNQQYSNIRFNIQEKNSSEIVSNVLNLSCDIGFSDCDETAAKINKFQLSEDELVILSHPKFGLPEVLSIKDFMKLPIIVREKNSNTSDTLSNIFKGTDIDYKKLKVICDTDSSYTQLKLMSLGLGVGIVSKSLHSPNNTLTHGLNISRIDGIDLTRNIYLIINSKRTLTPIANAFYKMCKEIYKL